MNNDLPNVFPGEISEDVNNTQEVFYSNGDRLIKDDDLSIEAKINRIFNSPNYIYKKDVLITRDGRKERFTIIGKTSNSLLTMDNKTIDINSISDIQVI